MIYQHDHGTVLNVTMRDADGPVDLTGAIVDIKIVRKDASEINKRMTIIDAVTGICSVELTRDDVSIPGRYSAQMIVKLGNKEFAGQVINFVVLERIGGDGRG